MLAGIKGDLEDRGLSPHKSTSATGVHNAFPANHKKQHSLKSAVIAKGIEMKTIGLIGGLGPESTVDYYKKIISSFNTKHADLAYPEIIIYSANLNEFIGYVCRRTLMFL